MADLVTVLQTFVGIPLNADGFLLSGKTLKIAFYIPEPLSRSKQLQSVDIVC